MVSLGVGAVKGKAHLPFGPPSPSLLSFSVARATRLGFKRNMPLLPESQELTALMDNSLAVGRKEKRMFVEESRFFPFSAGRTLP